MKLVLIRGLPGSGKTTMAKAMDSYEHYETDQFFTDDKGIYCFDWSKSKAAHRWCERTTLAALTKGKNVVVSNTFTQRYEIEPYLAMCKTLGIKPTIIEAKGNWPNIHAVPTEVIDRMIKRWEAMPVKGEEMSLL